MKNHQKVIDDSLVYEITEAAAQIFLKYSSCNYSFTKYKSQSLIKLSNNLFLKYITYTMNHSQNQNSSSFGAAKQRGVYSEIIIPDGGGVLSTSYTDFYQQPPGTRFITPHHNTAETSSPQSTQFKKNQRAARNTNVQEKLKDQRRKINETDPGVEPKVMEPFDPIPGRVPRKVAIDRKKKEYASFNIKQLLMDKGIDFNNIQKKQAWLPLEYFDDNTYDDFTDNDWISRKVDEEGQQRKLRGKGLRKIGNTYDYRKLQVLTYVPEENKYTVLWQDDKAIQKICRIYFCFNAEDPRKYTDRVANAFMERAYADSVIRYQFYVDNMPLHNADLPELDQEQKKRLENLAKNKKLKDMESTSLIMEVGYDYSRTMNKIIFDDYLDKNKGTDNYPELTLPPAKIQKQTPEFGMIQLQQFKNNAKDIVIVSKDITYEDPKNFTQTFKNFCFHSLYIKEQVIKALQEIRLKCNDVLEMHMFDLTEGRNRLVLEEFRHKQESSISQMLYNLKGAWIQDLIKVIKSNFSMVGKGWFNMQETSKITYDFGKLKRFLTMVRLMMQDSLLAVVRKSYYDLRDYIFSYIPVDVIIISASEVQNKFYHVDQIKDLPEKQVEYLRKKTHIQPLFLLDLVRSKQDDFAFSTFPYNFVNMIVHLFEKPLEDIAKIPDLEPKILSDLYKAIKNQTFIKAPMKPREKPVDPDPRMVPRKLPDQNKWIWDIIEQIKGRLQEAIKPLSEYKKSWQQYLELLRLDPDEFTRNIQMEDNPWQVQQIQNQIAQIIKKQNTLRAKLPQKIQVSFFQINCKEMKESLLEKYQTLQKNFIDMIAKRARFQAQAIFNDFQQIQNKIKQLPSNIQKLTDIKEYIGNLPNQMEKIKIQMGKCFEIYRILQQFNYRFTKDELDKRWIIFGSPKEINAIVEKRDKELEKDKVRFLEQMKFQQQQFKESIDNLERTIQNFHSWQDIKNYEAVAKSCVEINKNLTALHEDAKKFNSREILFDSDSTDYGKIQTMIRQFTPYSNLWITSDQWFKNSKEWLNGEWETLDAVAAQKFVEESVRILAGVTRFFKQRDIGPVLKIGQTIKEQIQQFKPKVPLMVSLRKKGMVERHWKQISDKVGFEIAPGEGFTFNKVLQMGLMNNVDVCIEVGQRASKEYNIEVGLNSMQSIWEGITFNLLSYKNTFLIKNYDEIQMIVDQHTVNTQSMQFSPFKKPFEEQIVNWNNKLKVMSDVLEEWAKCQGQWMYLQPIFDSADIAKQLPNESKKFKTVDSTWRHTMDQASKGVLVLEMCSQEGLLERLQEANKNLQTIQKELKNYLEKKRQKFARFYFLSDTDLLQILSQTKQPTAVQPHLKKVFQNINQVQFDKDKKIIAMMSAEKQKVKFVKSVDPNKKNVQDWMGELEEMMRLSIRAAFLESIRDFPERKRPQWAVSHPGQVVLNGSQVVWTSDVQAAIREGNEAIKEYHRKLNEQYLNDLVQLVRTKLSVQAKVTINALIVIDVHAKDVVEKLYETNVNEIGAFEWISQLRYYWENDDCSVKCIQTNFPYGYEYLGNTLRLVITPLTDKCYMTLMGALKLNLGGAPAGPAGTGKTESVKDLAKALAKQCVVFNCSDSMDYIMIGKFFKGLASAGAWCCFDEFNRINIQVLSVIAQQLLVLFGQKAKGTPIVQFEESFIKLLPTFSVFITMNPGYAGRTQLPDNLKALFRPMAMMVPDYAMIGQIMLYSFGFKSGRALAQKMVATFKLSSEQLSSQDHYDYGMRAVRSVINAAGLLKSAEPDMDEQQLLLRALRDVNVPKFLKDDLPLFENIIKDLFPGIQKPNVNYGLLLSAINNVCKTMNLQSTQPFIDKILQLYDTIQVRHGLMLVGPTGGGKTCNYNVLSSAMTTLHKQGMSKVLLHVLNPKSIKIPSQLYGDYNEATHEWSDGILAYTVRECVKDQSTDKHWIMFDGPVDALWIESMNTVLDDNKKLCLNSGQILTLTPHMTMMFEVEDLAVASPATVSRCGMVYMEPQALGLQPLYDSWFQRLPPNIKTRQNIEKKLKRLVQSFTEPVLKYLRTSLKEVTTTMDNNICQSLMRIIDCFFVPYTDTQIKKISVQQLQLLESNIESIFLLSFFWSFCCTIDFQSREKMNVFVKDLITSNTSVQLPADVSIYDLFYNQTEKQWVSWKQISPAQTLDPKMLYHEIMIPTTDSVRNIYFLKLLITNQKHVMNVGPTGTGKSLNINQLLTKELSEEYQYISMVFSAQTGCNQTQDTIDVKLDKRRKGIYGPPIGTKYVIFVDDLNMPKKEEYGAQPPIQLLRQYLDHQGWYNRKDLSWMKLQELILLTAMGPPGGGRTFITQRFVRHFNVIAYTELNQSVVKTIFSNLVNHFFKKFSQPIRNVLPKVIEDVLSVYERVKKELLPTPSKSHYTFNLRDIWRVFQGMCSASPKQTVEVVDLLRLWYHQNMRVYHDRLTTQEDRNYMIELLSSHFINYSIEKQQIYNSERLIYGDFMNGKDVENKQYVQIQEISALISKMDSYQEEYNSDISFIIGGQKKQMKLVMFLDACEHIARIARIIRQPQGNALVLGVGGSGRQSLSRMATYLTGYKLFQIEVVKNYTMKSWREDIKKVLMLAGIENKPLSFLFCDTQIINQQMLEDINNILNSGDVTGIYQQKQYDEINTACKGECVKRNIPPTKMNIFTQYLVRVKKNIHMIIAMSPLSELFSNRLRMFPSLINCSTIDWFTEWPEQALIGVGKGQLIDYEEELGIVGKISVLVEMFKTIHKSVEKISITFLEELRRHNYVTPTSYLQLLNIYRQILAQKRKQLKQQIERLKTGLEKLESANKQVQEMKIQLKQMQPELQRKNEEVGQLLQSLTKDQAQAQQHQKLVAIEEEQATLESQKAQELADSQERFCADAQKQLDETLEKVKLLKKEHLIEIRTFTTPSQAVKTVCAGLVILFWDYIEKNEGGTMIYYPPEPGQVGKKEENYFDMCKKYLMKDVMNLKKIIEGYDKDSISDKAISKLVQKVVNRDEFNYEAVSKSSYAASFLQMWIKCMYEYNQVYKKTEPMRKELAILRKTLQEKQILLKKKKDELTAINNKIDMLTKKYNDSMKQQQELRNKIQQCEIKLERAQKLTQGLSEEKTRWAIDIKNLQKRMQLIPGDAVISAGMIAYSGPFTSKYRQKLEKAWQQQLKIVGVLHTEGINMRAFLGDPVKIQAWNIAQLPKDDNSTENGIIIDKARRWPLMIDPQNQANKFIKNLSKQHQQGIDVVKVTDPNLMRTIELAVQYGRWVLLENVQRQLDPSLEPILTQQVVKTAGSDTGIIQIGDKSLSYNNSFKLFMTTTMPNPHYSPETFVKVTIINFAITPNGLEQQMLAQIVSLQNPNLEQKKTQIVKKNAADKKQLLNIEDSILKSLSQTKGGINEILQDQTLINKLQSSKKFAAEINQRVKDSKVTEAEIDKARESYRPVAYRSSLLYFCILDLSLIDPMYQYSLQWFCNLFMMGVQNALPSNILDQRLRNMNEYFTYSLYENICRSLFEKHKLLFSFLLTVKILSGDNNINQTELRFFLAGPSGQIKVKPNPTTWISQNVWPDVYRQLYSMSTTILNMKGIDEFFLQKSEQFKHIFDSNTAYSEKYPQYWENKLTTLQKIIFLKALRPDKVIPAVQLWISEQMGEKFIIAPTFDLGKCYKDSTITTPLIFVLSPGSDPVADFLKFAEECGMGKRIESISLGQGQGVKAQKLVRQSSQKGSWVILQNCHLAVSWMSQLQKLVEQLNENMHKDFRLWLTSMPTSLFPISVLQNGVKMTVQPPQGLRANLLRTYTNMSDQQLKDCKKPEQFKKLLFGFCLFHAIIQDRRKFGPIGWNIAYQFTNEDLTVCKRQLKMLLDQYDSIPYKVINFLGAEINYGGRVTDDKDVRLIKTILKTYIGVHCLRDGQKFSQSGHYVSIPAGNLQSYINYIQTLPLNPAPEAFGLHDNAEITNAQNQTISLLENVLSVQPRSSSGSGKSREQAIEEVVLFIEKRTPPPWDVDEIYKKYPTSYNQSMNTVLIQQLIRYNRLLEVMIQSIKNAKKALKGLIVMSEELEKMCNSLFDNQVPILWADKGFLSLKPLSSWINDLVDRVNFLQKWIDNGTPNVFWISGFFFPQAFITGTLQNFARKHIIAIDKIGFQFKIVDNISQAEVKQKPQDGCYIYGIFLQGCRWDHKRKHITSPKPKQLYSDLPMVHLIPINNRKIPTEGIYNCPVYKVVSRRGTLSTTGHSTNFVLYMQLPSKQPQDIWIKGGVAAFLSLRY